MAAPAARSRLPYFEFEFPLGADYFEIGVVGGDQPGGVGSYSEHGEHVEISSA
jgi:hypothetical protein